MSKVQLAWGKKVDAQFRATVFDIADRYGWGPDHPSWLMACMAFESAETFSPSIRNAAGSGATGLIQFMPSTARGLGTSTQALAAMTAVEQLDYVRMYFKPYASRIHTLADMYMAILMPKYVGRPDSEVLFLDPTVAYRQNSGLDANKDGKVTKLEAAAKVQAKLVRGLGAQYCWVAQE